MDLKHKLDRAALAEGLKGRVPFIATNAYDGATTGYTRSMTAISAALAGAGIKSYSMIAEGHANNARIRNVMAAQALAHPDVTDFIFIDTDMHFDEKAFFRLLAPLPRGEVPVLCAAPERRGKPDEGVKVQFAYSPAKFGEMEFNQWGHIRARGATAFMRIEREVFETIQTKRPDLKWEMAGLTDEQNAQLYAYFGWGPRRECEEDGSNQDWRKLEQNPRFEEFVLDAHKAATGELLPARLLSDPHYRERVARELNYLFSQGAGCADPLAHKRHFEGEDYWFVRLARESGHECWVDPNIHVGHEDKMVRSGFLAEHLPSPEDVDRMEKVHPGSVERIEEEAA